MDYLDYEFASVLADPLLDDAMWVALLAGVVEEAEAVCYDDLRLAANEADKAAAAVFMNDVAMANGGGKTHTAMALLEQ